MCVESVGFHFLSFLIKINLSISISFADFTLNSLQTLNFLLEMALTLHFATICVTVIQNGNH